LTRGAGRGVTRGTTPPLIAAERRPPLLMSLGPLMLELSAVAVSCAKTPGNTCWPWWLEHRHGSAAMKPIQPGRHGVALSVMSLVADPWVDLCADGVVLILFAMLSSVVLPIPMHHH